MHGFWTALAARGGGSWFHATWWPLGQRAFPLSPPILPLVPALAAAISALRGVTARRRLSQCHRRVLHSRPCTPFFMAWRLDARSRVQLSGRVAYSLTSVTQVLVPDGGFMFGRILDARRLYVVSVWDDTPHLTALALSAAGDSVSSPFHRNPAGRSITRVRQHPSGWPPWPARSAR